MNSFKRMVSSIVFVLGCSSAHVFCQDTTVQIREDPFVNQIRNSKGFCIGHFELVGFPRGQWSLGNAVSGDSGTTYDFTLQFSDSQSAMLYAYGTDVVLHKRIGEQCNTDEAIHKKAVVAAKVSEAVIRGSVTMKDNIITAIRIPKLVRRGAALQKGLSIIATQVNPSVRNVLGGTLEFGAAQTLINNQDDDLEITASGLNGSLRLRSSDALLAVKVGLKDDTRRQPLKLKLTSNSAAEINVALSSGVTVLENGTFKASGFALTAQTPQPSSLQLGRIQLKYDTISAEQLTLAALETRLTSSIDQISFSSLIGSYSGTMNVAVRKTEAATASDMALIGDGSEEGVILTPQSFAHLHLVSSDIDLKDGSVKLQGSGAVTVRSADQTAIDANLSFDSVSLVDLGGASEAALLQKLQIDGRGTPASYTGSIGGSFTRLRLGRAAMESTAGSITGKFATDQDLSLHLAFSAPGSFAVKGASGEDSTFQAKLLRGSLDGTLTSSEGELRFPADSIDLGINSLTSKTGKLLGGVPVFPQETLNLKNADPVTLNEGVTNGSLDFAASSFKVANPQVWPAAKDAELPLGGDLNSVGSTLFKAILGNGDVLPISGALTRDDITLAPPAGITSVTFRISGVDVEVKSLHIDRIEIRPSFNASDFSAQADIAAKGIQIAAERISQDDNPKFSGTTSGPVAADQLSGTVKLTSFPLQFTNLGIQNAKIKLTDVAYATPDNVQIHADNAALGLDKLTDTEANGSLSISDGRVHAADAATDATVGQLTLQFSGTKANPVANGTIRFNDIAFTSDTRMEVAQQCTEKGEKMPVRVSATAGGLEGPLSIADGKTNFRLASNDAQFQVFKDANPWQCEWDQKAGELAVSYPCCDNMCGGFIKYPCDCHICTHKISDINVRWQVTVSVLQMSGQLTQIKLKPDPGKGIKPCEGHITQLNPFPPGDPLFAINPTIPGGNVGADIARAAIALAVAPFTSATGNLLANLASVASFTKVGNSFYVWGDCD